MAKRLISKQIKIDAFVASPAKRAKKTAELFAKEYGLPAEEIIFIPSLYHAAPPTFYEVVAQLPDKFDTVAMFSHNPGITEFVNTLTSGIRIDNMPTCSVFAVKIKTQSWDSMEKADKEFWFFDYPKGEL